jgi:Cytochrome P460
MESKSIPAIVVLVGFLSIVQSAARAVRDRHTVKALNGVAFSEFRGYETWRDVAVSPTDTGINASLGHPITIKAYRKGILGNGKALPEDSAIVKIEWSPKKYPVTPYFVEVPDSLKSVSFIEKNSKRFPDTSGWGYAQFLYDAGAATFKPYGDDSSSGRTFVTSAAVFSNTMIEDS